MMCWGKGSCSDETDIWPDGETGGHPCFRGHVRKGVEQELEVLRSEIQACWNIPILKDNDYELVVVEVNLNRDGSLAENPVVTNSSQNKNFKVLAASAVRSVVRCAPFKSVASLSESYEDWRKITISFDPRELTR